MIWPFKRRPPSALELLNGAEWRCKKCELPHRGMFDIAAISPDPWPGPRDYEPNSAVTLARSFLSEDFCVLDGEHFMVRCVLEIPVHGLAEPFGFGCWGSLARENFERYAECFDDGSFQGEGHWWSWMCNQLLPFGSENPLGCWMIPQLDRQRPVLRVADDDHPLAIAQRNGISPEQVITIYREYGHELAT